MKLADEGRSILARIPIQRPFLFVDRILEVDENRVLSSYRFREDEFFYQGHFPGRPITPASILLECMMQGGSLAHALFLQNSVHSVPVQGNEKSVPVFSDSGYFEVSRPVFPGEEVHVTGEKVFFRMRKLRSRVQMLTPDGRLIARAEVAGILAQIPYGKGT